jgi:hypothetical protein
LQGIKFMGLRFDHEKRDALWTKKDQQTGFQRPRANPPRGATPEQKGEHKALVKKWTAEMPKAEVPRDKLLKLIGTDWSAAIFSPVSLIHRDDALYIATSAPLDMSVVTEILASEFDSAKKKAETDPA